MTFRIYNVADFQIHLDVISYYKNLKKLIMLVYLQRTGGLFPNALSLFSCAMSSIHIFPLQGEI